MPVPSTWADIFTNPAQNSPQGTEPLGTQADDYIRQAFAFCKQLHDGWLAADGSVKLAANLDANSHAVINLPAPVNTGDAVNKAYADALISANFPRGTIVMWYGQPSGKPAGWLICDGTNGTPDMRNRFPIGAGDQTAVGAAGGNSFPVISASQMPVHTHPVGDPGHAHNVYDPSHNHGVNDPGHAHGIQTMNNAPGAGLITSNGLNGSNPKQTDVSGTGIGLYAAATGVSIYGSGTGVTLGNAGGGTAFDNRPSYLGLYYLMKS